MLAQGCTRQQDDWDLNPSPGDHKFSNQHPTAMPLSHKSGPKK